MDPDKRCFGEYKCPKCGKTWQSGYCWPNYGQECKQCKVSTLAFSMKPLERSHEDNKVDLNKPHRSDLCGKCKSGYPCHY